MKGCLPKALSAVAMWGVFASLWSSPVFAQCADPAARIVRIANQVEHKPAASDAFAPATLNMNLCEGVAIRSGNRSRATIAFLDNGVVLTIEQNTEWVVRRPSTPGRTWIDLIRGTILFFTREPRSLDVQTPFVNAAVQGTEFLIRVEQDRSVITVFEGVVALTSRGVTLAVTSNQSAVAVRDQAPQLVVMLRPQDAVQWALYYPPVFPRDSFQQLEQIPEASHGARFYLRRAALLLGVGRLDEARADITEASRLNPDDGDADALRAVVAVALNDPGEALRSGRQAVLRSPGSVSARIALSYALQASFDLERARDELLRAVMDHPDDAGAWARLAELWLSLGYVDRAVDAAERAARLAPDIARTSTVLGFAALARVDISAARAAFERALALESDSPLARLGLGLARIRAGDLESGRREIEIAAALSPNDSNIRSYLGKAYFDERREALPGMQYDSAKRLDPLDPTPWFYDAIRKQTINRPVEALRDLEQAISLNDNRAVYRSRFLLDQDIAARSASLGRLYRDLGFEQLAPVEGWKSLEADPGDYSGHRLLADTYSALPRHELARVSELLQAQLLQPINITPIPVGLSEIDLLILEGAGPSEPAFNEFNPLFNRNRVALVASGTVGTESVFGDEVTVSGVWNRVSFSAGQFHYDTDGFRENNQQDRDLYNAFVQAQLSTATTVQAEFRSEDSVTGDLVVNFDRTDLSPVQTNRVDGSTARFGMRHAFSPRSLFIASVYSRQRDEAFAETLSEGGFTTFVDSVTDIRSWVAEGRHLFNSGRFALTSGAGYVRSEREGVQTIEIPDEDPALSFTITSDFKDEPEQANVYAYSVVGLSDQVKLIVGASGDFYRRHRVLAEDVSQSDSRNQFNPKIGLAWRPTAATTVRLATFRTLNRVFVASQTIEPTEVAGFNQLFADREGDEARRYGVAIDHKFGAGMFAGLEYARRDLRLPVEVLDGNDPATIQRLDGTEHASRSYFYWTPSNALSLSAEYFYDESERDAAATVEEAFLNVRTHRLPLGIRFFSPSGLSVLVKATAIDQSGLFFVRGLPAEGDSAFWVVDASIGYRLPRRYGRLLFELKNLGDETFDFQDVDPGRPTIRSGRVAVFRFVLGV